MQRGKDTVYVREQTEQGDIARSLEALINTQYKSRRFMDIMASTRLTRYETIFFSLMEILRRSSKILSLSPDDLKDETLSDEEQQEIKELYALKKRFLVNPHSMLYAISDSFEYMYGLSLQSLDGMSRQEGVDMVTASYRRVREPDNVPMMEKLRRRMLGDVLYPTWNRRENI